MKLIFSLFFIFIVGCTQGNCNRKPDMGNEDTKAANVETVWVYKYDGSRQCGLGEVISLGEMKSELEELLIYKMEKRNDGLMRTMNCGAPTGMANVYEIAKKDLELAKKLGFKEWSFAK
ncbi:MAG: hypothetical protein MK008_02825 [Bdellovibrionales bacterium]|nr:hypothetical protein [Bdellovibrionales bacterium]